jgi:hypothetical protein
MSVPLPFLSTTHLLLTSEGGAWFQVTTGRARKEYSFNVISGEGSLLLGLEEAPLPQVYWKLQEASSPLTARGWTMNGSRGNGVLQRALRSAPGCGREQQRQHQFERKLHRHQLL